MMRLESLPLPTGPASRELPGRNEPCPCGSGRKWKRCCLSMQFDVLYPSLSARVEMKADIERRRAEEAAKVR